jgi:phospholipid transport system substrate-binding protein
MLSWRVATAGVAVVLAAAAGFAAAVQRATPVATVEALQDGLLGLLKDADRLGYRGRLARIEPVIDETFDVPFMAEKAVGRHWKTLSDADRARWVALFREFMAANYAGNFDRFSGQRFEVLGEEPAANDTRIVRTVLRNPGGEDVELNYRLRTSDGSRIIDILLKGTVSELALRRSDYTSVLERDGFDALVTTLRSRIDDLAAGRGKRTAP